MARSRDLRASLPRLYRWLFSLTLLLVAVSPVALVGRPALFHHLGPERREHCLRRWAQTPLVYPRALWMLVRAILALARYDGPSADKAVGWTPALSGYRMPEGDHA